MANREDLDIDDDFSDLYKEYTGPPRTNTTGVADITKTNKRSHAGSDEEEETRDPNAVPTDFTSREAKVWEAKSKATERNWKKRKEEEMICKICGESGHFTQGCPSTLGANRKSQDFFERVPARDPQVKALFSEKVISKIEKDIGCKIKMEEKFLIVSGKDRLILAKGVDAVHKIKNEGDKKVGSSSNMARSRSPEVRSPVGSRMGRSDSQRSNPSPRNSTHYNQKSSNMARSRSPEMRSPVGSRMGRSDSQRFSRQEKNIEERVREDLHTLPRRSPQARAYEKDGARGRSTHSKSPARLSYTGGGAHGSYDGQSQSRNKGDYSTTFPQTLDDLHLAYKRDAVEITKIRDKEEDDENNRHREAMREMRENYMKRFSMLRAMHSKQWEEFLQLDAQRRQQRARQHIADTQFGGYKQDSYSEYENTAGNPYGAANMPMDLRVRYPDVDNYPSSRSHDSYGEFQRQRHEDYGKTYNNRY